MRRSVPVVALGLVLLALSLPIAAVGTVGPAAVATDVDDPVLQSPSVSVDGDHAQLAETPNRLVLHGETATVQVTPTIDAGVAFASGDEAIRTDYRTFAFESTFADLEDETNRTDAVVAEVDRIEQRVADLRDREQAVVAAHADGEASDRAVLRTVATNYYEAQELQRALERIDDEVGDAVDMDDPVRDFSAELEVYTGPIRTDVATTVRGDDPSASLVAIESGADGLVLSTIDGDEYVREATRYDNRQPNYPDRVGSMQSARELAQELYPWAFETTSALSSTNHGFVQLYGVEAPAHDHGELAVYVDGGTEAIYHERQTLDIDAVPIETTDTWGTANLTATLERPAGTAPATITVTDGNETPIDATIAVDDTVVGETGADGSLRFVGPADGFELSVETESDSVNATVATSR